MAILDRIKRALLDSPTQPHASEERQASSIAPAAPALDPVPVAEPASVVPAKAPQTEQEPAPTALEQILRVERTSTCHFYVGELFMRRFNSPESPGGGRHYVAFYREAPGRFSAVGYVNYLQHEDSWLCGGLVFDDRLYRRIPASHRALIKASGGVAEAILRQSFLDLKESPAIWGYVGDKQAEAVDLRAGFIHTRHDKVMVVWNRDLGEQEKEQRLQKVIDLGPF